VGASGLALVNSGWTGTVTITVGADDVVVTPVARTSAAEVVAKVLSKCTELHGGTWSASVTSAGVISITSTLTFTPSHHLSEK